MYKLIAITLAISLGLVSCSANTEQNATNTSTGPESPQTALDSQKQEQTLTEEPKPITSENSISPETAKTAGSTDDAKMKESSKTAEESVDNTLTAMVEEAPEKIKGQEKVKEDKPSSEPKAAGPTLMFFDEADAFLSKNVNSSGMVDYAKIKSSPSDLNALVKQIGGMDLSGMSTSQEKAFWINAYNILTIKNVVDNYPIGSPLDVSGFFESKKFNIAGQSLTLSDIENKKIRPTYNDARTHFALVCAAKGCPKLIDEAYMPEGLDAQLTKVTKNAFDNSSFIQVDDKKKQVLVSEIFYWYAEDFPDDIIGYINKYRSESIPTSYSVDKYTYNWDLNKQ